MKNIIYSNLYFNNQRLNSLRSSSYMEQFYFKLKTGELWQVSITNTAIMQFCFFD